MTSTALGKMVGVPSSPDLADLDTFPNPDATRRLYLIRLSCPEFTSLCPVTNQPDFAHFYIDYVPKSKIVESKSFKLFMGSFRNCGAFHEDCSMRIAKRLEQALQPFWLRVSGIWFPRGGIPIDIYYQNAAPPDGLYIPPLDLGTYRGR